MSILVIDAGTSGIRAAVVTPDGTVTHEHHAEVLPDAPAQGLVEFDADHYAAVALDLARHALADAGPVDGVGISNQRASTIIWDRATGRAVAPAQGWQDLRTVGDCLVLAADGLRLAPNQSATKVRSILDTVDPGRDRDLCFGTPDTWLVWHLSGGEVHATDLSNAAVTGLWGGRADESDDRWDDDVLAKLGIPASMMPAIVDSSGLLGQAVALDGSPPICGIAGDQQASLIGQGCVAPGHTKITFGTGAMLDQCVGTGRAPAPSRSRSGTFPIVCWRRGAETMWGLEAIMLSAGTNVQWLRDDLGVIESAEASADVAARCDGTDGVVYVPAQLGLGTPQWDYGARSGLFGLTRGTTRAQVVRAVLEGVARRSADLVDAAVTETGHPIETLRIDGGMSANPVFTQAVADATGCRIEVSRQKEATALGAAFLAGLALGTWSSWDDVGAMWDPARIIEPKGSFDREEWARAVERTGGWFGDLSAIDFS
jgi:glycerol kinase